MESVVLYIVGILVVAVGLALSIALHEIGHLVPAKLFGVRVSQYMIGFGPTLWSRRRGETEYGIKAIPLGGYVAMAGMYPPAKPGEAPRQSSTGFFQSMVHDARAASAETIPEGEEHRTFYRLPVWKRVIIMAGGPFMNLVLVFVFVGIVLMGFGVAQVSTTIGAVNECLIPASSERGECTSADPLAPAAEAGFLPGDRLMSVDGTPITEWNDSVAIIQSSPGESLEFVVEREGSLVTLTATPALTERPVVRDGEVVLDDSGEPLFHSVGMLGVSAAYENVRQPVTAVPAAVGNNIVAVGNVIINLPQRMIDVANAAFGAGERDPNGPMGVVGIGRIAGEITSINTVDVADRVAMLLSLIGGLNVALLVFNLIPLMPLDGGHIAGALWEGIRRGVAKLFARKDPGPVDTAKLIPLTFGVVTLLGGMTLLLLYADIVNPITLF